MHPITYKKFLQVNLTFNIPLDLVLKTFRNEGLELFPRTFYPVVELAASTADLPAALEIIFCKLYNSMVASSVPIEII